MTLLVGSTTYVEAATYNVDLNSNNSHEPLPNPTYVGTAGAPDSGTVWNGILPSNTVDTALVDSQGAASSVVFFENFGASVGNQQNGDGPPFEAIADRNPLISDIWIGPNGNQESASFGFKNLNPSTVYDLYVYNTGNGATVYLPATYTVNNSISRIALGMNHPEFVEDDQVSPTGGNYVVFRGLTGTDTLSITMNNAGSAFGSAVSGLQLYSASPNAVPGDFDGDGDVDGADFVAWQTNFPKASGATLAEGDADGDGDVDGADFVVWQTNFPFTPAPGASPVPEPASLTIVAAFGICLLAVRRRLAIR